MDIKKLNPWNWFKHEEKLGLKHEENSGKKGNVPVKREELLPAEHPLSNMMQLHREIDRLFDDAVRGFPSIGRSPLWNQMMSDDFMPVFRADVNVASDNRQYTISLEAPGMEQKDLSIELKDRALLIKGTKQQEQEDKDKHFYRVERRYGTFQRVLAIPDDAIESEISASMKNGVLTVMIPRKEQPESEVKRIAIRGE